MKCHSCNSEWTSPAGKTLSVCPFCMESLVKNEAPKSFDSLRDVLVYIASNTFTVSGKEINGRDILLSDKIVSFVSDMASSLTDERELLKIIRDKGALEVLKAAVNAPSPDRELSIKRAASRLPAFMDKEVIVSVLYDFAEALGWGESSPAQTPAVTLPEIGSIYHFCKYDWRVLAVENGKALLISEEILEKRHLYHSGKVSITWENCTLRKYLNGEFLNKLGAAKSEIADTRNSNPDNPWYDTPGGNATTDKIFLLSLDEVCLYFGDNTTAELKDMKNRKDLMKELKGSMFFGENSPSRIAKYTDGEAWYWWLRSPGRYKNHAAFVDNGGCVIVSGIGVSVESYGKDDSGYGIRPALWLNL